MKNEIAKKQQNKRKMKMITEKRTRTNLEGSVVAVLTMFRISKYGPKTGERQDG